jgi:predicted RNA-binding protein with TRAM domain
MENNKDAPVNEGEKYDVFINSVGGKGDGIAKIKGFVLFVPNTKEGDYVQVLVKKVLKNAGFAEVVKVLEKPAGKPPRQRRRFETISQDDLQSMPVPEIDDKYDDTEDFGDDLEDED